MSIIVNAVANMSEADKEKLGKVGTKLNIDGEHLLTIVDAYEITWESDKGSFPSFVLKCENAEGKTVEWSAILKQKVGKDSATGVVKAGEYSVNGVKTYLDNENQTYDNLRAIGQIKNLWKITGLDEKQFGAGIVQKKPGVSGNELCGASIGAWCEAQGGSRRKPEINEAGIRNGRTTGNAAIKLPAASS